MAVLLPLGRMSMCLYVCVCREGGLSVLVPLCQYNGCFVVG